MEKSVFIVTSVYETQYNYEIICVNYTETASLCVFTLYFAIYSDELSAFIIII